MTKDFSKGHLNIFFSYFKPHYKLFLLDLLCALIASAIDLTFPVIARNAMYEMLPGDKFEMFFTVMAIVAIAFVLRIIMNYIITYWGHMFGVRVEADLRDDLYSHIQTLDFRFFDENKTGQIMSRMTGDLFEITELAHHGPEDMFIAAVTILGSFIIMMTIQWQLALLIIIIIPVFLVIVVICRRKMVKASKKVKVKMAEINSEIESGISGMRTSKAFANEKINYSHFSAANEAFKTAKCDNYRAFGQFNSSLEYCLCIMPVAILTFGGWLIMNDEMNYIDLITFYLFVSTFISPIRKLSNFTEMFMNGWAGLTRFVDIMRMNPEITDSEEAQTLYDVEGNIEFKDVTFSYDSINNVLHDVNLFIPAGKTVAVVGASGGGKSTLCQLIPRFYDIDKGSISIDGTDIKKIKLESLRKAIGIIQQDVFLFADTVMENIRYGNPDASDEDVIEAAKKAEIYEDIATMPNGFDTYVGERGVLLSGGQKQRIAIARIFLKNPQILILDEATSALDTVTEAKIQQSFDNLAVGRTSIIIAHRLSTIKNVDFIILIDEGRIKEWGTHTQLMAINGMYSKLYTASMI